MSCAKIEEEEASRGPGHITLVTEPPSTIEPIRERAPTHDPAISTTTGRLRAGRIAPGTLIGGCYRVKRALGEGGMGVVLHGEDEKLQRDVAIKFIRPERVETEALREAFVREARAMARTRHPNLVEIYSFGEFADCPYFVMEYVEGTDLDQLMYRYRGRRMPVDDAVAILDQLCRGVGALHDAGSVHRDLKPSNVLIGPGFRVVVTDMGLARTVGAWEADEGIAGTPGYMAPEIAAKKAVPPDLAYSVDVYSLAVIAFEMLTGELPFEANSATAMLQAHVFEHPRVPSEVCPELGAAFDRVLLQALHKDPARRTRSADALRSQLLAARERSAQRNGHVRVLIADDDPSALHWTSEFVRSAFPVSTIETAPDGEVAVQLAMRHPPDIALLDLNMPKLNGIELTATLRAKPKTKHVPIVVVTGVGGATDWRVLKQLGASGFLVKPVDPEALIAIMRRLLHESQCDAAHQR